MGNPLRDQDIIHRLEAAIGLWSVELADAQSGLDEVCAKVRDHMGALRNGEPAAGTAALEAMAKALAGTKEILGILTKRMSALEQSMMDTDGALREGAAHAEARHRELLGRIGQLTAAGTDPDASGTNTGTLGKTARATGSELGHQLTQALRDREEAHQEIVKLRQELGAMRAAVATPEVEEVPGPGPVFDHAPVMPAGVTPSGLALDAFDADGQRRRMGEILVRAGVISAEQVRQSLSAQDQEPHKRLGAILVEQGLVPDDIVGRVLASQLRLPYVDIAQEALEAGAAGLVSAKLASHHECVPVRTDGDRLVLAMANPLDLIAIEDVEMASGLRVDPVVAAREEVRTAMERVYGPAAAT